MKAICCICFNLLDGLNTAACPCGHTFHEECLIRWMDTSSTCPSCRTDINKDQIIKRLFFDIHESCQEDVDVDMLLNQINNLKVQLGEKEKQRQELAESRDRMSTLFANSEAAREILLTKLNEEKRELAVILKENAAEAELAFQWKPDRCDIHGEYKRDARVVVGQYSEDDEPSLKHIVSLLRVFKREYKKVLSEKTVLQGQVSELKHSHSEAEKCIQEHIQEVTNLRSCLEQTSLLLARTRVLTVTVFGGLNIYNLDSCVKRCDDLTQSIIQGMRDLNKNYIVKYNNLRKVLSKRTLLQWYVSKPNLSRESNAKTLKRKLQMRDLRTDFAWILNKLTEMGKAQSKISSEITETLGFHYKLLWKRNTDTCSTSAQVPYVSRENLKRKFVSEIDETFASEHLEALRDCC